jgi:D-alanyl-D-alanine carboxypeptidase
MEIQPTVNKDQNLMSSKKYILLSAVALCLLLEGVTAQAAGMLGLLGSSGFHNAHSLYTQYIAERLEQSGVPGAIVGIWQPGRPDYLHAFGEADIAKMEPMSTRFSIPIGNVTTSFTSRIILELAKTHKIQLDAPVSQYLRGVPNGQEIRVADLLQMRSGLFDYTRDATFIRDSRAHPEAPMSPDQLLKNSFTHPLLFKPGTRFDYSATNTILLGLIIEKVTGQPLATVVKEQILRTNKLANTQFVHDSTDIHLQVRGYSSSENSQKKEPVVWNPSQTWASGAMMATASNLARWAKINADLKSFSSVIAEYKLRPHILPGRDTSESYHLGSFESNGWIGNDSRFSGFECVAIYSPRQKKTIVLLLNSDATKDGVPVATMLAHKLSRFISPKDIYQPIDN